MKIDMHCHVHEGSIDSRVSLDEYITVLKEKGFDGMLITDHDSYHGYRHWKYEMKGKAHQDFVVLKGIEYDTLDAGHMLCIMPEGVRMRLLELKGLPVSMLIEFVHRHGGILGPAHPYGAKYMSMTNTKRYRKSQEFVKRFDFIEVFNACESQESNDSAARLAAEYGKPGVGGSDAHKTDCIGTGYTILPEMVTCETELINLIREKAAIQAAYDIMHTQIAGKKAYSSRATDASQSNIAAQEEFISSRPTADPQRDKYPIAMMFEGGWWENEARGAFDDLVLEYGEEYGYGNRRFGYMPFPRFVGTPNVPDQINTKPMLYSDIESSVFISAYSPRKDIAKKFLQFSTSNAMLSLCTKITGVVRPFTYTMSKEDLGKMTEYGKDMYNIYSSSDTRLVTGYNLSPLRRDKKSYFDDWDFGALIDGIPYGDPIYAFSVKNNYSAADYIRQGAEKYTKESWQKMLNR